MKFFRKLLKGLTYGLRVIVTDRIESEDAAKIPHWQDITNLSTAA
jgi:hypothetical protein